MKRALMHTALGVEIVWIVSSVLDTVDTYGWYLYGIAFLAILIFLLACWAYGRLMAGRLPLFPQIVIRNEFKIKVSQE